MLPFHYGRDTRAGNANCKSTLVAGGYGMAAKWRDLGRTTTVASYPANAWGLRDMHGNVAEWCQDWYDKDYYAASPADDPKGPRKGNHRVLRGGSWLVTETSCRSASRFGHAPSERTYYAGFRVARNP
jgi:formylglycine-generating enzyme required for sulfatase activity